MAEGHGGRLLFFRCSQENQQIGRNNATPCQNPVFLEKYLVNTRVKARLSGNGGGGASASIALAVARVQLASLIGRFILQTHGARALSPPDGV